ncbi:MAG: hypothetical protein GX452_13815 [Ignavibacteriales bacterium]|nr:hypothetical protein [Ignavibacteriales bacterium]
MKLKRKKEIEEIKETMEFKRENERGYDEIYPINDNWETAVQIGFTKGHARIIIPEAQLYTTGEDEYAGSIEIKKGFYRTFFEKRGDGYSSVAGDYYIPSVVVPIAFKINSFGEEKMIKRPNGFKTYYVDKRINALDYISEEYKEMLTESEKVYFSNISLADLRDDFTTYMAMIPRPDTPYYRALWHLVFQGGCNIFEQITEPIYTEVPTGQFVNADIVLIVGSEIFEIKNYSLFCKNEFSCVVKFNFKDKILEKIREEGYK